MKVCTSTEKFSARTQLLSNPENVQCRPVSSSLFSLQENKVRITLLSRKTQYRNIMNEDEVSLFTNTEVPNTQD